jgi:hypothetical protein
MLARPKPRLSSRGVIIATSHQGSSALDGPDQAESEDSTDKTCESKTDDTLPTGPDSDRNGDDLADKLPTCGEQTELDWNGSISQGLNRNKDAYR